MGKNLSLAPKEVLISWVAVVGEKLISYSPVLDINCSHASTIRATFGSVSSSKCRAYGMVVCVQTRAYLNAMSASSITAASSPERPKPS